jgi:hypothetical protein
MLSKLLSFFRHAFTAPSEQEELDKFIAAQHPTSVGDVEYWMGVYDRRRRQHSFTAMYR